MLNVVCLDEGMTGASTDFALSIINANYTVHDPKN